MMIIELKKKKESPVGTIIFTTLLCWGPIVFLLWVYFTAKHRDGIFFLLFLCFGLMVVGIYSIYSGKRMTPKIELDDEKILMNNKYYYWKDLVNIDLWGSVGIGRGRIDGTILTFYAKKDMIYFIDSYYSNITEVKAFLKQKLIDKTEEIEPFVLEEIDEEEVKYEDYETFKGNPFTSVAGIFLCLIIIGFSYSAFILWQLEFKWVALLPTLFSLLFFFFFCYGAKNTMVSQSYLMIKYTILFWKINIFKISNVERIIMLQDRKMLKIISNDLTYKKVSMPNLRKNTFLSLKERLIEQGVTADYRLNY